MDPERLGEYWGAICAEALRTGTWTVPPVEQSQVAESQHGDTTEVEQTQGDESEHGDTTEVEQPQAAESEHGETTEEEDWGAIGAEALRSGYYPLGPVEQTPAAESEHGDTTEEEEWGAIGAEALRSGAYPLGPVEQPQAAESEDGYTSGEEYWAIDPEALRSGTWRLAADEQPDIDKWLEQLPDADRDSSLVPNDSAATSSTGFLTWRTNFISSRGNEYFCEIDEDYLTDRFNLTGLNTDVQYYQYALDLVTDVFDLDCDDEMREQIEKSARHLYGLVHARYITTTRGLSKMLEKYKKSDFGKCPRVACASHPLLPTGLSDLAAVQSVKLYCAKCEDLYNPKSSRHATIDGAYFGTSFSNILFQVYPALVPEKSVQRYEPRIFGFKVHAAAALERWQARQREEMLGRLREQGIQGVFVEEAEEGDDEGGEVEGEGEENGVEE